MFLISISFLETNSQTYSWTATNSPLASFRYEDVYFLNPDTGYAVHYYDLPFGGDWGYIIKTTNGGNAWTKILDSTNLQFRDVGFTDALHGFVGTFEHTNIGADTNIIYQTSDGGLTWTGAPNFPGPDSAGICGLRVVNSTSIYGVGRYEGHAGFYKTIDNGLTWSYKNLDSLVSGLVDISFFNADTGFIIGTTGPSYFNGKARILYTTDAGLNWSIAKTSIHNNSLGWKLTFPSRKIGYVSMQFFNSPSIQYFFKTTDGGITWQENSYSGGPSTGYDIEGMGFLNDTIGWVGGSSNVYYTLNGGSTWALQTWGNNLNRFRFLSDTLAYAAGNKIYKMNRNAVGVKQFVHDMKLNMYPNPTTDQAYFEFYLYKAMRVKLSIYDLSGREVEQVFDKNFSYGNQHFVWYPQDLAPGVYICKLIVGDEVISKKLEITR